MNAKVTVLIAPRYTVNNRTMIKLLYRTKATLTRLPQCNRKINHINHRSSFNHKPTLVLLYITWLLHHHQPKPPTTRNALNS